jgi:hypothetical protein
MDAQRALATSNNAKVIISPDNGANDMLIKAMALYDEPTSNNKTGQLYLYVSPLLFLSLAQSSAINVSNEHYALFLGVPLVNVDYST